MNLKLDTNICFALRCFLLCSYVSFRICLTCNAEDLLPRAEEHTISSPNGVLKVHFSIIDGITKYSVTRFKEKILDWSQLGFRLVEGLPMSHGFQVEEVQHSSVNKKWAQPWGESRIVIDKHNEMRINLVKADNAQAKLIVVFRVFDDGIGFRYEFPKQEGMIDIKIAEELTEFVLTEDVKCWWIPAFSNNRYEYLYQETPLSETRTVHTPLTAKTNEGVYLSIHEAALVDYASMALTNVGRLTLQADLYPWSDGVKVYLSSPFVTPWRTITIVDSPGELITSDIVLNLNEPCKIEDTSWINPGKYVGVWWEMHLGRSTWSSGPNHGATNDNVKRFIDFASRNGFDGVLVEGWNQTWDGNWMENGDVFSFTRPYPHYDLTGLTDYANDRGVSLIAHNETSGAISNYESQLEEAFSLYEKLGIRAVKSGYVSFGTGIKRTDENGHKQKEWHHGQYMVRHYQNVVEQAAKHKLMMIVHEPIKQTGIRRTYPNLISSEGARGQEYNSGLDGGNPPNHTTILPFTRMLAGPMDFTPGIFDLTLEMGDRPNRQINTTLCKQLALYVLLFSPWQMAADFPEIYENHPKAFQFICDVPTNWEETRVLNGEIGDYVTIVRKGREGDDWYLGSATDETGRLLKVPLSFLDRDQSYSAIIYQDAIDTHFMTNPKSYQVVNEEVNANTILDIRLAPGGGQAIRFVPNVSTPARLAENP